METFFYIVAALMIALAVPAWKYRAEISRWISGGPIAPSDPLTLSQRADMMTKTRDESLRHAAQLEKEIARTRSDLDTATSKLAPPPVA